jgi:hypothetical protein
MTDKPAPNEAALFEVVKAARPFARETLSTEPQFSDCVYRTPAMQARLRAEAIEQRDAQILDLRTAIANLDRLTP